DSPYRIGIWRVLAQSSKENFSLYRNKILEAFKDPLGADRVHAAETLAKLGLPLEELAPEAVTPIIKGEKNSLFVYTLWGMANSRGEEKSPNILFDFIKQHKGEKLPLMQAAYALRHYGQLNEKQWEILVKLALDEPKESIARVYLLSSAFVHAPDYELNKQKFDEIHEQLTKLSLSENTGEIRELALALGERGSYQDLPILVKLKDSRDAAIRGAASYAILKMDSRLQETKLAQGDWVVVVLYLLGMVGIGFFYSRRNKNDKDYYLGGGKMNPIAVGLSLFATLLSSLSYLSYPGE